MKAGCFYFLKDEYFARFPDEKLARNYPPDVQGPHQRPYFYAFPDAKNDRIFWMVPVSSRIEKYRRLHDQKVERYGFCDTILFGKINGRESAFLIQNICPVTERYVDHPYIVKGQPVKPTEKTASEVQKEARSVLSKVFHRHIKLVFPDIRSMYAQLDWELMRETARHRQGERNDTPSRPTPSRFPNRPTER